MVPGYFEAGFTLRFIHRTRLLTLIADLLFQQAVLEVIRQIIQSGLSYVLERLEGEESLMRGNQDVWKREQTCENIVCNHFGRPDLPPT